MFWNGQGGCGKLSDEVKFDSQAFRYTVVAMAMQDSEYYFNKCSTLKEELICSAYGRLQQMRINYFFHVQKKLFLENEYKERNENKENNVDFGIKTFVPDTLIGSYAYWKKVKDLSFL